MPEALIEISLIANPAIRLQRILKMAAEGTKKDDSVIDALSTPLRVDPRDIPEFYVRYGEFLSLIKEVHRAVYTKRESAELVEGILVLDRLRIYFNTVNPHAPFRQLRDAVPGSWSLALSLASYHVPMLTIPDEYLQDIAEIRETVAELLARLEMEEKLAGASRTQLYGALYRVERDFSRMVSRGPRGVAFVAANVEQLVKDAKHWNVSAAWQAALKKVSHALQFVWSHRQEIISVVNAIHGHDTQLLLMPGPPIVGVAAPELLPAPPPQNRKQTAKKSTRKKPKPPTADA